MSRSNQIKGVAIRELEISQNPETYEPLARFRGLQYLKGGGEIMQYTGLQDKNGWEIYEGDIIKHFDHMSYEANDPDGWLISEIRFDHGKMAWDAFPNDPLCDVELDELEVIGNVYENPELFKEGNHEP